MITECFLHSCVRWQLDPNGWNVNAKKRSATRLKKSITFAALRQKTLCLTQEGTSKFAWLAVHPHVTLAGNLWAQDVTELHPAGKLESSVSVCDTSHYNCTHAKSSFLHSCCLNLKSHRTVWWVHTKRFQRSICQLTECFWHTTNGHF